MNDWHNALWLLAGAGLQWFLPRLWRAIDRAATKARLHAWRDLEAQRDAQRVHAPKD
jgi:hypothetical protein